MTTSTAPSPRPAPQAEAAPPSPGGSSALATVARAAYLAFLLYGFLVAIQTMSGAFKMMGKGATSGLFEGVENPFAALAVGVLATVLVQSSSVTTSVIVSLVGSGTLDVSYAVPMVMGANIGTTITNTIVSVGSVRRSQEFRRAFAAATVHDFFNLANVAIFLPIELATGALSRTAIFLTDAIGLGGGASYKSPIKAAVKSGSKTIQSGVEALGIEGTPLAVTCLAIGILLVFICLQQITRTMRALIARRIEQAMNRTLSKSGLVGIGVGAVCTFAVQSSSITTSLLVPLCGAGILSLSNAFPIMLGANLGTTITAVLASLGADTAAGLTIAIVHVLFNVAGISLFYFVPVLRRFPIRMARTLALRTIDNRLWILAYVGGVFVALPLLGWLLFR
jgi:sodium-dependent phosphate cotransporter